MPEFLRIEFPDACYHVVCHGNARLPIFELDADRPCSWSGWSALRGSSGCANARTRLRRHPNPYA